MNSALIPILKDLLAEGLAEDSWSLDWTAIAAAKKRPSAKARIVAKSEGIWTGEALTAAANLLAKEMGLDLQIKSLKEDGAILKKGDLVTRWSGESRAVLAFERPFLNLASYMGGIAWQTSKLVMQVKKTWKEKSPPPRVTLTRKTLPHYRDISIHSVILGGGYPHRVSLSGGVLIKENHIAVAGSVAKAIENARAVAPHSLKIEIEVTNQKELDQAVSAGAEIVMLDNFSPAEVEKALRSIDPRERKPVIEVSGGITEENIGEYAIPGVNVISVGSLTHSVRAIDLSLLADFSK